MIKCIEIIKGEIKIRPFNLFIENTDDMEAIEFWEERLEKFNEPYAITYCKDTSGKLLYSIYCNTRKKGSMFK